MSRNLRLLLVVALPVFAGDPGWLDQRYAHPETKTPAELRLLRNEVFARHGRTFKSADLQGYFSKQPWYKPDPKFSEAVLDKAERALVQRLLALENAPAKEPRSAAEYVARAQAALAAPKSSYDDEAPAESALELYGKALALEPDDVAALKGRAEAYGSLLGDHADAMRHDRLGHG